MRTNHMPINSSAGGYSILLHSKSVPEKRALIHQQIKTFNDTVSPHHQAIRDGGIHPLEIYISDAQEHLLGGLVASTYWGWLDIDDLWLAGSLRNQGWGSRLVTMAETEAIRRGCDHSIVHTYSFQARGFYEKMGYHVVGTLSDYPPGATFYWLRKELQPNQEHGR